MGERPFSLFPGVTPVDFRRILNPQAAFVVLDRKEGGERAGARSNDFSRPASATMSLTASHDGKLGCYS
jgi:hypothetical protein